MIGGWSPPSGSFHCVCCEGLSSGSPMSANVACLPGGRAPLLRSGPFPLEVSPALRPQQAGIGYSL